MIRITKNKIIFFITLLIFNLHLFKPVIIQDPDIDFQFLKTYYKWLTPRIYNSAYKWSKENNLSVCLVLALINSESEGDINAISRSNARGLCQVMTFHNPKGNAQQLHDVDFNLRLGTGYLRWCIDTKNGNLREALRIYNAGPNSSREQYKNWQYVNDITKNNSVSQIALLSRRVIVK